MVTHLDEALVGILHGIGDKVGEHLLYAALVEDGTAGGIGIVLDELYPRLLHSLGERLADVVEEQGEVYLRGFDGERLAHRRGFEDVVDEPHEHVAVVADNADELHALLIGVNLRQQVAEAHDGIQRGAYLVGHVGQEGTLHAARVFCATGLLLQSLLSLHEVGDVTSHTEVGGEPPLLIALRHTAEGIPAGGGGGWQPHEVADGIEVIASTYHAYQFLVGLFPLVFEHVVHKFVAAHGEALCAL